MRATSDNKQQTAFQRHPPQDGLAPAPAPAGPPGAEQAQQRQQKITPPTAALMRWGPPTVVGAPSCHQPRGAHRSRHEERRRGGEEPLCQPPSNNPPCCGGSKGPLLLTYGHFAGKIRNRLAYGSRLGAEPTPGRALALPSRLAPNPYPTVL